MGELYVNYICLLYGVIGSKGIWSVVRKACIYLKSWKGKRMLAWSRGWRCSDSGYIFRVELIGIRGGKLDVVFKAKRSELWFLDFGLSCWVYGSATYRDGKEIGWLGLQQGNQEVLFRTFNLRWLLHVYF